MNELIPIFRILPKKYKKLLNYKSNLSYINCHDGQKKILFSIIEFLSLVEKKYNLSNILLVYIGEKNDYFYSPIIFDLFPTLTYFLCGENLYVYNHIFLLNSEKVFIQNKEFNKKNFLDIKKFNKKNKDIIFISNIRSNHTEDGIFQDMIIQQYYCIKLNSLAYMLKFRLENNSSNVNYEKYNYNLPKNIIIKNSIKNGIFYLTGNIYLQLYKPISAPESRLIYIKKNKTENFKLIKYNIEDYIQKLIYFNEIGRHQKYIYLKSQELKYYLIGYNDSYECVSEYYIIHNYLKSKNFKEICKNIYWINNLYYKLSNKDPINIYIIPVIQKIKKNDLLTKDIIELIELTKDSYINIYTLIKNQYKNICLMLKNKDYNILNKKDYENQINIINIIMDKFNKNMNIILNNNNCMKNTNFFIIKKMIQSKIVNL